MSLSRPVKFPLLKLPFLCTKSVIKNWDLWDVICFATISRRTRRIVKYSNYPLEQINVSPSRDRQIGIGDTMESFENKKNWHFIYDKYADTSFNTIRGSSWNRGHFLKSYTAGNTLNALKMGVDIMIDAFGCKIGELRVDGNKISELFGFGITSAKVLFILDFEPVNRADLKYLLETIKVTEKYVFYVRIPEDFHCDPRIFKSRQLYFALKGSADWVTLEILCQFDVAQLSFTSHRFSVEDIVSYITHWFYSDKRRLEWVRFEFNNPVSREDLKIDHLNPMPFCGRRRSRYPLDESWTRTDMSSGMDILRQDGLLATFFVGHEFIIFYIWHKRFPDTA